MRRHKIAFSIHFATTADNPTSAFIKELSVISSPIGIRINYNTFVEIGILLICSTWQC